MTPSRVGALLCATVAAIVAILLGGCVTERQVGLPPLAQVPQIGNVGSGKSVTVVRPQDSRSDRNLLGVAGDPIVGSVARTNDDVSVWVGNAMVRGLEQAGFHVERVDALDASPTPLAVTVDITEVSAVFSVEGGQSRVIVQVEVHKAGESVFKRTYGGIYTSPPSRYSASSAEDYQALLQGAIDDMLGKAIPNLAHALSTEAG